MARNGGDERWLTCPVCGKLVWKPAHVKTCSRECANKRRYEVVYDCQCIVCGVAFKHKGWSPRGLCPECYAAKGPGGGSIVIMTCPVCGKVARRQSRYIACSRTCGNILQWRPRKRFESPQERHLYKSTKRRMQMVNADGKIEIINPDEIFERDKGICGICGGKVKRKDASMDHIQPLSLGGEHTSSNIQLAHLMCNIRRGNQPLEEYKKKLKERR